jgi:hypothetical protein
VVGAEATTSSPSQIGWFHGKGLSSVDDVDDVLGRASLVFALAGESGSWGVKSTADALFPPVLGSGG